MKLQILIPHYKESAEEVRPLLDSIALQQQINFHDLGVIICHDGNSEECAILDFSDRDIFPKYPYEIQEIHQKHKGVSAARNACLDAAKADYVMWCDADDMFANVCGLYIVFREMNGIGFNALKSVFLEETRNPETDEHIYINREMDSTFVHGKIYRRDFLVSNNIRWNDSLTIHEDSYFNCLAQSMAGDVKYCSVPFYLWKWRDQSVCRHDPKYILKTYNNMLDSNTALIQELLRRGKRQEAIFYASSMIYDAYFMMNKDEWLNQDNQNYRNATELRFKSYFEQFKNLFESVTKDQRAQIIMGMKNRFFGEGLLMETITFDDWIKHIQAL